MSSNDYAPPTPSEVSFVRGGPFYRAQRTLKLMGLNQWNLGRRIGLAIVIPGYLCLS
jgi:hypothetical protein